MFTTPVYQPHLTFGEAHPYHVSNHDPVQIVLTVKLTRIMSHIFHCIRTLTRHTQTHVTNTTNRLGCSRKLHQTSSVGKHMTASAVYQVRHSPCSWSWPCTDRPRRVSRPSLPLSPRPVRRGSPRTAPFGPGRTWGAVIYLLFFNLLVYSFLLIMQNQRFAPGKSL